MFQEFITKEPDTLQSSSSALINHELSVFEFWRGEQFKLKSLKGADCRNFP